MVFGADIEVVQFISISDFSNWKDLIVYRKITEIEVLKLLGESLIYIGNSLSDGMPNTLLEAIIMGAYPIQSNPGKATEEIINSGKNGLLIENPEDENEIRNLILSAINDKESLKRGVEYNNKHVRPELERDIVKQRVLKQYKIVEEEVKKL